MNRKTILYVEDDARQRISFARKLRQNRFKVVVASSGKTGLEKFLKNPTYVILCDLNMPEINGIAVLTEVKKVNPDVICIVTSAHGSVDSALEAIKLGAYDFITKPLHVEKFKTSLNRALELKKLEKEVQSYSYMLKNTIKERTEKLKYANRQLSALNKLSSRLSRFHDEEKLLDNVPHFLTRSLDFDRSLLLLEQDGKLVLRSFKLLHDSKKLNNTFKRYVRDGNFPIIPPGMECFKKNKTIFIQNPERFNYWEKSDKKRLWRESPVSFVLTPIRIKNKPIGVLAGNIQHHARELDNQDIERFETFANMVGLTLANIRSFQDLEIRVRERTADLKNANTMLNSKAKQLEKTTIDLAEGNVRLLSTQEMLESKNTEMKDILSDLSRSKDELQALLDSSVSGIIMVNPQNKIVAANPTINKFFGIDIDKLINKSFDSFTNIIKSNFEHPINYTRQLKKLKKLKRPTRESHDHVAIFKNALKTVKPAERFISMYSSPVTDRNNKIFGRVWAFTDVTLEKEADEQIHAIIEVSPIPYVISRVHDGKILFVNEPLADLLGYSVKDLIGRTTPDFYYKKSDRKIVLKALKKDGYLNSFETQILKGDGEPIWMIFSLVTTTIAAEKVIIGALYDITKLKNALEDLEVANENIKNAQTQLVQSEKMASLGMLVAGVAHEINNPIGALQSMHDTSVRALNKLKLLLRDKKKDISAKLKEIDQTISVIDKANEVIKLGADRVSLTVKQLKSFARLDEAELQKADIHEGIEQALMLSLYEMKNRIKVIKEFGKLPLINSYPAKLNQVYLNMIINAVQAMPLKGTLRIKTKLKQKKIHIEFTDSGVGIPEADLNKIFDPGYTTKGVGVGTGLGLSICFQIIKEHQGEITVKSEVGKGTTFKIILPTNLKFSD